jgi:hypothetical protein
MSSVTLHFQRSRPNDSGFYQADGEGDRWRKFLTQVKLNESGSSAESSSRFSSDKAHPHSVPGLTDRHALWIALIQSIGFVDVEALI